MVLTHQWKYRSGKRYVMPQARCEVQACTVRNGPGPVNCYPPRMNSPATIFLEFSRNKLLEQYWPRLRGCVERLTDEQVWWRPNEASNNIGNMILHLNGNVGQWLIASFNKREDSRNRPAEFHAQGSVEGSALIKQLGQTMEQASEVLSR